ncbi:hypothetical protein V6615_12740 [Oscillospiraceae bacterium PP1C4]
MQDRGVFTRNDLTTQWYNASKKFRWGDPELVGNPTGILKEIKHQIDAYSDPCVLRLVGSFRHFVVAYGYTGSCTSTADVKIKDPYGKNTTLSQALKTWPTLKYLKRII